MRYFTLDEGDFDSKGQKQGSPSGGDYDSESSSQEDNLGHDEEYDSESSSEKDDSQVDEAAVSVRLDRPTEARTEAQSDLLSPKTMIPAAFLTQTQYVEQLSTGNSRGFRGLDMTQSQSRESLTGNSRVPSTGLLVDTADGRSTTFQNPTTTGHTNSPGVDRDSGLLANFQRNLQDLSDYYQSQRPPSHHPMQQQLVQQQMGQQMMSDHYMGQPFMVHQQMGQQPNIQQHVGPQTIGNHYMGQQPVLQPSISQQPMASHYMGQLLMIERESPHPQSVQRPYQHFRQRSPRHHNVIMPREQRRRSRSPAKSPKRRNQHN